MFDTMQVAKRIRNARIEKNLTQAAVADALGVSYQAVSNWERGNSMPDIAKLPELCALLGVSFESLVGGASPDAAAVQKAMDGEPVTIKEAASVAQLLPPEIVRAAAEQAEQNDEPIDYATLLSLAPFMDNETLDRLADKAMLDDFAKVRSLAPFLSESKLNEIVLGLDTKADWAHIVSLAPFLSEEMLDRLVRDADGALSIEHVVSLAPFLSSQTLDEIADNIVVSDAKKLKALAPFLSQKTLDRIAGQLLDGGASGGKLVSLAPFLSKDTIRKIADRLMGEKGYGELSKLWPFL